MLREGPTGELALSLVTSTPPKTRLPASAPVGEEIAASVLGHAGLSDVFCKQGWPIPETAQ